jgi:hypothetical protein
MKGKLLTIVITMVFCISIFGVAVAQSQSNVKVDTLHPSGITLPAGRGYATVVAGDVHNYGAVDVYGTMTATVKTSDTLQTFTNTSERTLFPALQTITVSVTVEGPKFVNSVACYMTFNGEGTTTAPSGGNGNTATPSGGNGNSAASGSNGNGAVSQKPKTTGGNFDVGGVAGITAGIVAVGAVAGIGFFVVKKRRVSEQSLRRLSSFEFQDWVTKRIFANPASQKDVYLGIDAYTAEGYPVQIRQDNDVGKRAIDSFAAAMARNKARMGTIVAFGFGNDALEGVSRARLNYKLEVKTVTVKELLARKDRTL